MFVDLRRNVTPTHPDSKLKWHHSFRACKNLLSTRVLPVAQHWHKPWHERQCSLIRGVGTQGLKPRAMAASFWCFLEFKLIISCNCNCNCNSWILIIQENISIYYYSGNSLFQIPRQPKQQERGSYAKCHSLVWGVLQSLLCWGQAMSSSQAWAPS